MEAAINANLLTSVRLVREAVPHMREGGWGRICLITATGVKEPETTLAASATARTGLWAWAKLAARDLADDGITLNLACPGRHATDRALELGLKGTMGDPGTSGRSSPSSARSRRGSWSGAAVQVDGARQVLGLL